MVLEFRAQEPLPLPPKSNEQMHDTSSNFIHDKPIGLENLVPFVPQVLREEINSVAQAGHEIQVVSTQDGAYDRPEAVMSMFEKLQSAGEEFAEARRAAATTVLAGFALTPTRKEQRRRNYDATLEAARARILYEPTGGTAWHNQRGMATALLTIQEAGNLRTEQREGAHKTMSAMLDESVLDHVFGRDNSNSLSGMTLREAMINAGGRFYDKKPESANRFADRKFQKLREFITTPASDDFRDVVEYCTDSLGIRARKQIVRNEVAQYLEEKTERDPADKDVLMVSVGCGTALPIFEVAADVKAKGFSPKIVLLDQDPIALASAVVLARKMGMEENIELHCERLFGRFGKPIDLNEMLDGRKADLIEDSGLREYLPERIYRLLTKEAWSSLRGGGMMLTGNMNANRPQAEFLHGLMGWSPEVVMRPIQECVRLHQKAGVDPRHIKLRVTQDGVYTIYVSKKPV